MTRRGSEFELFKIAGVQIAIDFSWLIVFALVFWSLAAGYFPSLHPGYPWLEYFIVGLGATLLFFASIVVHELSHAMVANRLGDTVKRISLFIFGGMAQMSAEPASARNELLIAGAGPLTSLVLGAIFWVIPRIFGLYTSWPMWASVFAYLGFINIALAIFNLLPGFPLDGGRILRAALWKRWGDFTKATAHAANWGRGIAYGLIALGAIEIFFGSLMGGLWLILIAFFLKNAAVVSYRSVAADQALEGVLVRDVMAARPVTMAADLTIAQAVDEFFLRYGYGGFPVLSGGRVIGLMSFAAVRGCPPAERTRLTVRDLMRPLDPSIRIAPSATASDALRQMAMADEPRLLVMEQDALAGIISRSAIIRFLLLANKSGAATGPSVEESDARRISASQ